MAEFAIKKAAHASTGLTPFFVNNARLQRVSALFAVERSVSAGALSLGIGGTPRVTVSGLSEQQAASKRISSLIGSHQRVASGGHSRESINNNRLTSGSSEAPSDDKLVNGVQTRAAAHAATGKEERDRLMNVVLWTARTLIDPRERHMRSASKQTTVATDEDDTDMVAVSHGTSHARVSLDNSEAISEFLLQRQSIGRFVRDSIANAVDLQKENADKRGRKNKEVFVVGDRVTLSTE